jgi:hypothetical protein
MSRVGCVMDEMDRGGGDRRGKGDLMYGARVD